MTTEQELLLLYGLGCFVHGVMFGLILAARYLVFAPTTAEQADE